jgi:Gpi18-like mannosyltransferase
MTQGFQRLTELIRQRSRLAFCIIVLMGLLVRFYLLPTAGMSLDLVQFYAWGTCANHNGWFGLYVCNRDVTHPPINPSFNGLELWAVSALGHDVSVFDNNRWVNVALKTHLLIAELVLVGLVFHIVRKKAGDLWAVAVTALVYWNPGIVIISAWWGQNDVVYTLFVLLTAYLVTQHKIRWAWLVFGIAWLAKFQSVMFLPVFGILSLRRYGLRATIEGGLIFALVFGGGTLPFLIGSGKYALTPYFNTVNLFPDITNGAHNMWYWISGSTFLVQPDSLKLIGNVTYGQAGLVLLILGTALLCVRAWFTNSPDEVYLLFAAANLTFFMLPTQIQARYLYPGVVFLAMAMLNDWKLVALYLGVSVVFMYNILGSVWLGVGLLFYPYKFMNLVWTSTANAVTMTVLFLIFMWLFFRVLWKKTETSENKDDPGAAIPVS